MGYRTEHLWHLLPHVPPPHWWTNARYLGIEVSAVTFSRIFAACAKVGELTQADHWIAQAAVVGVTLARGSGGSSKAAATGWVQRRDHVRMAAILAPADVPVAPHSRSCALGPLMQR